MNGEIVGIASFILSESGNFQGLGFTATLNVCKAFCWTIPLVFISGKLANALNVPQGVGCSSRKSQYDLLWDSRDPWWYDSSKHYGRKRIDWR